MTTLILTVIGDDRSGLVDSLSGVITANGGNWDRSHLAHLAGKFAGIVEVTIPDGRADELLEALKPLESEGLLDITASVGQADEEAEGVHHLSLEVIGADHPGIIHDLAHAVAESKVSIVELRSETRSTPMGGGDLFEAEVILEVPNDLDEDGLIDTLEELADKLMVDIEFDSSDRSAP